MAVKLYDYQIAAVEKMQNGCILCGGVGSGKSRTALAYYYLQNGGEPSCLTGTEEYIPMEDPPKDLYIITTARKRDTMEWEGDLSPFLLSIHKDVNLYSNLIKVDSWNNIGKYADVKNAFFIFDEQRVIGAGAWVKAFLKIAKSNQWILLSATPGDTWQDYIPVFVANGFYKNRTEFIREHVVYSRFSKFPKIDQYEPITTAAGLCYIWRKIVNTDESRQLALLEIVEKHPRAIIFYNFDYELELLKELFIPHADTMYFEIAEWNGHKHQPIPKSESWVYLVQYNAGAEGWNCIKTDTIIFYSQNYSYKIMQQSAGRIDRLNTPFKDLYYYHLKSRSGIDLAISKALKEKKDFNETRFVKW